MAKPKLWLVPGPIRPHSPAALSLESHLQSILLETVVNQSFHHEIGLDDTDRQLKSTINSDAADLICIGGCHQ